MLNRFYFSLHFQGFKNYLTEIISRLSLMSPLSPDKQNEKKKKEVLFCLFIYLQTNFFWYL